MQEANENAKPFQIAILDYQMPGKDGVTLGRIIKNDFQFKNMALVMLTSTRQKGDAKQYKDAGFDAYLNEAHSPITTLRCTVFPH